MKRCVGFLLVASLLFGRVKAQAFETQQLLLDVEKLAQLKQMLADLKKGYQILYKGYSTVKQISEGNFNLHQAFLDALLQVSPAVRNYKKITEIIALQVKLADASKAALKQVTGSGQFTPAELQYIHEVYTQLQNSSHSRLEALYTVITSGVLRMNDSERLKAIDAIYEGMQQAYTFLRQFQNQSSLLALQRLKEAREQKGVGRLYGFNR